MKIAKTQLRKMIKNGYFYYEKNLKESEWKANGCYCFFLKRIVVILCKSACNDHERQSHCGCRKMLVMVMKDKCSYKKSFFGKWAKRWTYLQEISYLNGGTSFITLKLENVHSVIWIMEKVCPIIWKSGEDIYIS